VATATLKHANGATHPALPLSLEHLQRGPVEAWPRSDGDTTTAADAAPAVVAEERLLRSVLAAMSRWRAPSGDTVITWAMAATVALVVVDAAIVSYSHIYGLATWQPGTGAETGVQARLLPLSIDGVIAEASLVKLYAARHKGIGKTKLATFMLTLGIVATVAANVTHGLPTALLSPVWHTVIMALMSAWPAGAFIGSVEMAMGLVRNKRAIAEGDTSSDSDDREDDRDSDTADDRSGDRPPPSPRPSNRRRRNQPDPVTAAIKKGWDDDRIIAKLGVTKRTIQRRRSDAAKAEAATGPGAK